MSIRPYLLPLVLSVAAGFPAVAQQTTAPAGDTTTAAPAEAATPAADGVGSTYTAETFGDWELRCVRAKDGSDPCQLYQLLKEENSDKPFAEISMIALPEGQDAVAGASIIVPLETLLTQQLNVTVDGGQTKRFAFTFCAEQGCVARVGFVQADIDSFKKGKVATISVVPVAAPDRFVNVDLSLAGFTAGFEAVKKANAPKQ